MIALKNEQMTEVEQRLAELEEAQLLHEQELYDARAEFDDLAAAMGWSKRDLVNGIGPMDYARNLKARAESAEVKK
ncbi:hypothetical protein [Pantoea sp. 1.19]|uniref:hypothetical protein n=1 Tax=Pantoea sp. 1.19 TaxID=1925589 RepID=UPI000948A43C|nr:hypothetical protein [Pantoea sp. 1.19]